MLFVFVHVGGCDHCMQVVARLPVKRPARFLCMVCCLLFSCSGLMSGNALATCLCSNLIAMHVIYCVLLSTVYSTTCGWHGVAQALREPCHSPCVPLLN